MDEETSISDNIISPTSYGLHRHLHMFQGYSSTVRYVQDAYIESQSDSGLRPRTNFQYHTWKLLRDRMRRRSFGYRLR